MSTTLEDLKKMSAGELVALHNKHNPDKPVKKFSDKKTAIKRTALAVGIEVTKKSSSSSEPLDIKASEENSGPVVVSPKRGKGEVLYLIAEGEGTMTKLKNILKRDEGGVRRYLRGICRVSGLGIKENGDKFTLRGKIRPDSPISLKSTKTPVPPTEKTKRAELVRLLSRANGATLSEIQTALELKTLGLAREAIRILNSNHFYAIEDSGDGQIRITN